jgi:hypothetical protein
MGFAGAVAGFAIVVSFSERSSGVAADPHWRLEYLVRRQVLAFFVAAHAPLYALGIFSSGGSFFISGRKERAGHYEAQYQSHQGGCTV